MKILLLTQWYPPEPQKVVSDVAESLRDRGHEVTVLTGFPNYPSGKLYPGYRLKSFQRETIRDVPVIRVPLFPDHSRSGVKRALNFLSFAGSAALLAPWLAPRVDAIYVIHPPLTIGIPAAVLSCLRGVPFIYEIQDMWPETLRATGMVRSQRVLDLLGWCAKRIYRRAAAIRVISPGFRDNLVAKGVPSDKVHVISNWVDTEFYRPVEPDPGLAAQTGMAGRFNVMFAGMIGLAQGLDTVLDAAWLLRDRPEVQFVLVGDGADLDRLQRQTQARGLENVRFLGRYPAEEMPRLYALADLLLVHLRDDPLFRITIPHKVFAYMASAKPVLVAANGDAAEVVASARAGLSCPPSNPQAMADAVRRFCGMSKSERRLLGENARRAACQSYARGPLTAQIAAMLEGVVERPAGERRIPTINNHCQPKKELAA
jgi:colanic acid biosynthesis glycosyl transferase WcaI